MPIDYSKWDKIELSDDSDIEVHPNVDKKSFIKWKQRDIHEKRQQRNLEIKQILIQLTMYAKLNERVDALLEQFSPDELLDSAKASSWLAGRFDGEERFDYEKLKQTKGDSLRKGLKDLAFSADEIASMPPYNEMIEDLLVQVKEDHPEAATDGALLVKLIREHRHKIDGLLSSQATKLDDLLYQKSLLISSDDYHTGFDRSFMNREKEEKEEEDKKKEKETEKQVTIETINSPQSAETAKAPAASSDDGYDDLKVLPATAEFAKLSDLDKSAEFLIKHPSICTENQKDSLIMTAFDHQLEGNGAQAKHVVFQSLLLQYIAQLAGANAKKDVTIRSVKLFFAKIKDASSPASRMLSEELENVYEHIKKRCEVLKESREGDGDGEEEGQIQLKTLDDSTTLEVKPPAEGTAQYDTFVSKVPEAMQKAVLTGELNAVNEVFTTMTIKEAEDVLEVFEECGVINLTSVLENEQEFEQLKEQYEQQLREPEAQARLENLADEVD